MTVVWRSFLISFMVDARGGAMRGCRHSGVRVIIPARKCSMPTRVTCRLIKKEKLLKPLLIGEGEGLAARVLELGPVGTQFLGPIVIEVPHFASLRGKERQIVVMRCDNGESWYEHPLQATEQAVSDALGNSLEGLDSEDVLQEKRITRILTTDFPQYFALVTRVRQESMVIGYEGGVLSSTVVPQVQAVLPEGTLTKPIRVGLQALPIPPDLVAKLLGNRVAVSPIVTVEPRRRKFHKPITLTVPVPKAVQKGMINQYGTDRPTLRLLYSLAADPAPACWEDITDNKQMSLVNNCVSFTTTVSARFWLIDCQNTSDVARLAGALYQEAITPPYMAKFVVFGKCTSVEEGQLRLFCMTDDRVDKTLEKQEKFVEIARSQEKEVLEGHPQYIEMAGNLIPVTKSGDQLHVDFKAFRENRLSCIVKIRDLDQDPAARVAFMKERKLGHGEAPQPPICNLDIHLPGAVSTSSSDLSSNATMEIQRRHMVLRQQALVLEDAHQSMVLSDVADNVQGDWVILAQQLGVSISVINHIKNEYPTLPDQALAMLHLWVNRGGPWSTGNALEAALHKVNRGDVIKKCKTGVMVEAAERSVAMDQSGLETLKQEDGIMDDPMICAMPLDVQYDEQDLIKESESAEESSICSSDRASTDKVHSHTSVSDDLSSQQHSIFEEVISSELDYHRTAAPSSTIKAPDQCDEDLTHRVEVYTHLAQELDKMMHDQDAFQHSGSETPENFTQLSEAPIVYCEARSLDVMKHSVLTELQDEVLPDALHHDALATEAAQHSQSDTDVAESVSSVPVSMETGQTQNAAKKRIIFRRSLSHPTYGEVEEVTEVGPEKEMVQIQQGREVLADGTVLKTQCTKKKTLKLVRRSLTSESGAEEEVVEEEEEVPGSQKEELFEMYQHPAKLVQDIEEVEKVLPDGTKVSRKISHNRMVHSFRMKLTSIDMDGKEVDEGLEMEEVVPGTESAFDAGIDSDYEEEMDKHHQAILMMESSKLFGKLQDCDGCEQQECDGCEQLASDQVEEEGIAQHGDHLHVMSHLAAGEVTVKDQHYCDSVEVEHSSASKDSDVPAMTVANDLAKATYEDDSVPSCIGIQCKGLSEGDSVDRMEMSRRGEQVHRVMMKKEVHQKTTESSDGREITVIKEESNVHHDADPPEELRESMQQIIDQFLSNDPDVPMIAAEEKDTAADDDKGTQV